MHERREIYEMHTVCVHLLNVEFNYEFSIFSYVEY